MTYREKMYETYVSTHMPVLSEKAFLDNLKREYPLWDRRFGAYLPTNKDAKVLDIGCGKGEFLRFLLDRDYKNAIGIDVSKEQIEQAHNLGIKNVQQCDLRQFLSDKMETYDAIVARDVIEHFTKDEILQVIGLIYRALKKTGVVIIQTINAESPFVGRYRYGDFTHEIAFTKSSLSQILKTIGFKELHFCRTGPLPYGVKRTVRYFLWKIIEIFIRAYVRIESGPDSGIYTQNLIVAAKKL